jgi:hypothetical protein
MTRDTMKLKTMLALLIIISAKAFAINLSDGFYTGIDLTDTTLEYSVWVDDVPEQTEKYAVTWETVNNMLYINFNYTGRFMGNGVVRGQKRYLVLYGRDYIFFYDNNNTLVYSTSSSRDNAYYSPSMATATSELKEGTVIFSARNMVTKSGLQPWAEGKKDSGIGEKITISLSKENVIPVPNESTPYRYWGFHISNGFVDYARPYLYGYNNRVKKLRVSRGNNNNYIDITVEDTPQLQYFSFQAELTTEANILQIEILEVYSGSHYDDTCINLIIPWGNDLR